MEMGLQNGKNWSDGIMVMVMGGLLDRLPFIWRLSRRSRYRMLASMMMAVMEIAMSFGQPDKYDGVGTILKILRSNGSA